MKWLERLALLAVLVLFAFDAWNRWTHPGGIAMIPGATPQEQRGPNVSRGYATGQHQRSTLLDAHGDSWVIASRRLERTQQPWDSIRDWWAGPERLKRDFPFDHMVDPEIRRILGDDPTNPTRRRTAALYLRAYGLGLKGGN